MTDLMTAKQIGVTLQKRPILREVDVSASAGELVAIVGPNGAGKSTLLRVLAGLLQPGQGSILLEGRDVRRLPRRELATKLAYLPQDQSIHWAISVLDVAMLGRLPHRRVGRPLSDADHQAVASALQTMDVLQFSDRPVTELSGGERARVLIARALAQEPLILLADEPAAGLDAVHQLELFAHLRRLADAGRSVVVVLHDLSLAARFSDRLVIMKAGRIHVEGPGTQVLSPQVLEDVYDMSAYLGDIEGIPFVIPLASLTGRRGEQMCTEAGAEK